MDQNLKKSRFTNKYPVLGLQSGDPMAASLNWITAGWCPIRGLYLTHPYAPKNPYT